MVTPQYKPALERFLGMVTNLTKSIPASTLAEPLREPLQREVVWHRNKRHEEVINNIKETLVNRAETLGYYKVKEPVKPSVDAFKSELAAVLLQNSTVVSYALKTPTKA